MPSVLPSGIGNFRMQKERNITMENEKKEVPAVQELSDESLNAVSGGADTARKYGEMSIDGPTESTPYTDYEWKGTDNSLKYLCPRCHRPVHPGTGWRYYCDPCNESWLLESNLELNLASGGWTVKGTGVEITERAIR